MPGSGYGVAAGLLPAILFGGVLVSWAGFGFNGCGFGGFSKPCASEDAHILLPGWLSKITASAPSAWRGAACVY